LRLRLTEKNKRYWESNKDEDEAFIESLFSQLTDNEIKDLYRLLNKLEENINQIYGDVKKGSI
jgi:DNA-binding MarR family transcriptional regulator